MKTSPRILFSVAVDPNALQEFADPVHKQTHVSAGGLLRQYGILSFGPGDKQALLNAIGELKGRPHQVWKGVVEYLKTCGRHDGQTREVPLAEFLQSGARLDNSADVLRLAVVANSAQGLADQSPIGANTTERKMLLDIDESTAVIEAGQIGTYPPRTSRNAIAEQLLKPLAARSKRVKIMDPYILEHVIIADASKRRPLPGVKWLLNVLAQAMPPNSEIWLIGTLKGEWSPQSRTGGEERLDELLEQALQDRDEPLKVEVRLVQAASTPLKNRYLWFDCGTSFDVLHDFYPLGVDPLTEELRFVRQDDAAAKRTYQLAECYEKSRHERGRLFFTKDWGVPSEQAAIQTTPLNESPRSSPSNRTRVPKPGPGLFQGASGPRATRD